MKFLKVLLIIFLVLTVAFAVDFLRDIRYIRTSAMAIRT